MAQKPEKESFRLKSKKKDAVYIIYILEKGEIELIMEEINTSIHTATNIQSMVPVNSKIHSKSKYFPYF